MARWVGLALRAVFVAISAVRHPRPIHARGLVLTGSITWLPRDCSSGISWIDDAPPGPVAVTARLSRSLGLPPSLPDVIGLALRVATDSGPADIELATTGLGVPSRFMLFLRRSPSEGRFTTLLPYDSSAGAIEIGAWAIPVAPLPTGGPELTASLREQPWRLRLYYAAVAGRWHPFATMQLELAEQQDDHDLRFDAVRHPLPGTSTFPWVRAVRQPSYDLTQRPPRGAEPADVGNIDPGAGVGP
jgi:hypothetical protein